MRIPSAESNEFPNDNPALHHGASWICLDPLSTPRLVARPGVIAKATAALAPIKAPAASAVAMPAASAVAVRSTLLPPPSSPAEAAALTETDEFVARFLARISVPPAPRVPAEAQSPELAPSAVEERSRRGDGPSQRMAPIAQFMLDELPSYRVRRSAASVPPPPAHAYVSSPTLRLEAVDVASPLALVESWLPPAPVASQQAALDLPATDLAPGERVPTDSASMDLQWRAESPWSVLAPEPHVYRAVGWDSTRPAPMPVSAAAVEAILDAAPEASLIEAIATLSEVAEVAEVVEEAPASVEDPIVEVVQIMEIAATPEAPPVEISAAEPAAAQQSSSVARVAAESAAYDSFVAALSAVLLQRGATRGAAVIAGLIEGACMAATALGETLVQQLSQAGIGEQRGEHFLVDPGFAQAACGWKALLSAESEDFSSCAETLDDWATRLVGALLPNPAPAKDIRRELRRKGVAAFGMLAAA